MEKTSTTQAAVNDVKHLANGFVAQASAEVDDITQLIQSIAAYASKKTKLWMKSFSKAMPETTTETMRKNWKPIVISTALVAIAGVSAYFLIQKLSSSGDRKPTALN